MAEKFSIRHLVAAALKPRLDSGERIRLRDFAEGLYDENLDDFALHMREIAINQVIVIARKLMSQAVEVRQGSFDLGDLPVALAVPVDSEGQEFEHVAIEHASRAEARHALAALKSQRDRFSVRISAIEDFIELAESRGCPDDGVLFDYLNGHGRDPGHPLGPQPQPTF